MSLLLYFSLPLSCWERVVIQRLSGYLEYSQSQPTTVIMWPEGGEVLHSCQACTKRQTGRTDGYASGQGYIQRDLDRLEEQDGWDLLKFNTEKWKSCPWEGITPPVRTAWLGVALTGSLGDPGGQGVEHKPAVCSGRYEGQLHPGLYEPTSQSSDGLSLLVWHSLGHNKILHIVLGPQSRKDINKISRGGNHWGGPGLENSTCKERLEDMGWLNLDKGGT